MSGSGREDGPSTRRRRLAIVLLEFTARAMPAALRHWASAMRNELPYVQDRDVVRWSVGCAAVAVATRVRRLYLLDVLIVRIGGVLLAVFCAFDSVLPTMLTIAYRSGAQGATAELARATPGDDYQRLVAVMEVIPDWLHALLMIAGACYLVAAVCVLLRRRAACAILLLGVALHVVTTAAARPLIASVGGAVVPHPSVLAALLLPVVFPLLLAFAAWSGSSRTADL